MGAGMNASKLAIVLIVIWSALLAGCASTREVASEVRSYVGAAELQLPATYRFERLPSQQSYGEGQSALEQLVQPMLAAKGLRLLGQQGAAPRYTVQIGVQTQRDARSPWEDASPGMLGLYPGFVVGGRGQIMLIQPMPAPVLPWYQREVTLLVRDVASGQVVYETHAVHAGYWADSSVVLQALFEAALSGFPTPPSGPRQVLVTVP